jgi:hypothetical protein
MMIFKTVRGHVRYLFVFGLLAAMFATAHAQVLEVQPTFNVGDKWTYRYHNIGDKKEAYIYTEQVYKTDGESGWIYGETQNIENQRKQNIKRYDYKRGDVKEFFEVNPLNPQNPGVRYSNLLNKDDAIKFPLTVGKKYQVKWDYSNNKGYTEYEVEVQGFEKIKVEAGEFDAYRIKFDGWWYNTVDNHAHGRAAMTQWFSPSAKRLVKIESKDTTTSGTVFNSNITELVKWESDSKLLEKFEASAKN